MLWNNNNNNNNNNYNNSNSNNIANIAVGLLLTRSSLTRHEVSFIVFPGSFYLLVCNI